MNDINFFIPFGKSDKDERIVEGVATSEALDSQGEIIKYDAIKDALPNYLGDFDDATGRYKFGNIREMHQHSAVGKTIGTKLDDTKKQLTIAAKVIDDNAWKKVKEGVYAGFSIGGRVVKQSGNVIERLILSEISLVDRPANPQALFSLVKFDKGGEDMKTIKKEDDGVEVEDKREEVPHEEIYRANYILNIAADICMLCDIYESNGVDTKQLVSAVELLKEVVAKEMGKADEATAQKYTEITTTLDAFLKRNVKEEKAEVEKAEKKTSFEEVKSYFKSDAWVDPYFAEARKILG